MYHHLCRFRKDRMRKKEISEYVSDLLWINVRQNSTTEISDWDWNRIWKRQGQNQCWKTRKWIAEFWMLHLINILIHCSARYLTQTKNIEWVPCHFEVGFVFVRILCLSVNCRSASPVSTWEISSCGKLWLRAKSMTLKSRYDWKLMQIAVLPRFW